MANEAPPATAIEVKVDELNQLFDTLDPFPFRERDLDKDAEDYIAGWARELPRTLDLKIVIYVPEQEKNRHAIHDLEPALRRFFAYRAEGVERDLKNLFRIGRLSLVIGLTVLTACAALSQFLTNLYGDDGFVGIMNEGLIILGWVANWKPLEIFLYEWWPVARRRNLYRRLAKASVEVRTQ